MIEVHDISKIIIGLLLFISTIKDIKSKSISLPLVIISCVCLILIMPFNNVITIKSAILGTLVGFFIILVSKLTKGQIGIGDGIILLATGLGLGVWDNIALLLFALFLSAICCFILLALRLVNLKMKIPFIPFLFISYIGVLFR